MQAVNPYLPNYEYVPDGEPYVFHDRVYIYGSHDKFNGTKYCMNDYVCWSASVNALGDWRYEGVIYKKEQDPEWSPGRYMYAPDIAVGCDGRYYLYYTLDAMSSVAVAVAESPAGPFEYYGRVRNGNGSILGEQEGDVFQFDPGVLVDEDGSVWLYTGFGLPKEFKLPVSGSGKRLMDGAYCVELEKDMLTVKSAPVMIIPQKDCCKGTLFEQHPFFEASSIRKIRGVFYFVYSSSYRHELCYATSKYPDKGFRPGGTIISNGDIGLENWTEEHPAKRIGNNHGGMVKIKDQWYIFYHRQTNYNEFSRQGCAEPIQIDEDGKIKQVEMTSCGLNGGPLDGTGSYSAAIACQLYNLQGRQEQAEFTQEGNDRENTENQYIAGMKNDSVAVFKYFDLSKTKRISICIRGAAGVMYLYDKAGGTEYTHMTFPASDQYFCVTSELQSAARRGSLTFVLKTEGSVDFKQFTLF